MKIARGIGRNMGKLLNIWKIIRKEYFVDESIFMIIDPLLITRDIQTYNTHISDK